MKQSVTIYDIKETLKSMGYAFNRRWFIKLPSGNYIENTKLGGWNGLELWTRCENGRDGRLATQSESFLKGIIEELKQL